MPLLSVGLPVHNGEQWLSQSVESMLAQSFGDFELIISDNASTDGTRSLCEQFAAQDDRVRYHRNPTNIGVYRNFNRVLELSSAKYFKWAAVGDFCLDGFFEKCVAVLESREDVVLVYPRALLLFGGIDGTGYAQEYDDNLNLEHPRPADRFRAYLERERFNNVMHGIVRASAVRDTALHRPYPGSDISMIAELSLRGKFLEIPERLFARRFDAEISALMMSATSAAQLSMPAGPTVRQRVNLHSHRFLTVARAPIDFREKLRAWLYLFRRVFRLRHQVIRSLRGLLRR